MSDLKASVGVDFALLGTNLHAAYEKSGENNYAILLLPSVENADNGISIGEVIEDIKKLVSNVDDKADTTSMEADLQSGIGSLSNEGDDKSVLDKLIVKLQMAYLYIRKMGDTSVLEYAFQLQVVTRGMIPEGVSQLIDVDNLSISVWNTTRQKVLDRMSLVTINEYIGIEQEPAEEPSEPEA